MFWIISAIFILVALAFVLPTLLRKRNTSFGRVGQDVSREQNIFIANEQLRELEERFEKGELESEDYESARDELEQSLFSDIGESDVSVDMGESKPSVLSAIFIALLIPAIAIFVYLKVGNLSFTTSMDSKVAAQQAANNLVPRKADGSPDIETMIVGLQKKMNENPNNVVGWTMLGRSYMVLKKYPEAVKAYDRALQLKPKSVDIILSVADSLAMANNGEIAGRPIKLIDRALKLEPNNLTALWLGGMAARQQNDHILAIERWKKVLALVNDPNEKREISSLISEAMSQLSPDQKAKINEKVAVPEVATNSSNITVTVSLSDKFKAQASPDDLVFIYAKAMSGPPMPLAALKKQVKDLPLTVKLNDSMAMMPSMKLSSFSDVRVGARISKTGKPIAQNGDLFSEKSSIKVGDKVELIIDTVVEK